MASSDGATPFFITHVSRVAVAGDRWCYHLLEHLSMYPDVVMGIVVLWEAVDGIL